MITAQEKLDELDVFSDQRWRCSQGVSYTRCVSGPLLQKVNNFLMLIK
jgi:hypothetical protein